jgi:phage-related protein (TIGR01555 family)
MGAALSQASTMMHNNRYSAITLNRALLSSTYNEHGVIQVLIQQPVDDAFRGGIILNSDELDAEDLKKLDQWMADKDVLLTYGQALIWARLFGGGGIIINAGQDMSKPLNINAINEKTPLEFYAVDRWELNYMPDGQSGIDQLYKVPSVERPYNYYGHILHKSNVIKLMGKLPPSLIRGQFGGWGVSELEKVVRSFNQYLKNQDVSFECMDEAKVDVFKISGFNQSLMTPKGAELTSQRVQLSSKMKNYQNSLVLDTEDEWDQKTMTFAGLSDIMQQIRIGLAADLRMPLTKLFGISAAGFSSGTEDIENYNAMIESEIRSKCRKGLLEILKIGCQQLFGYVPESLHFEFKPLRIASASEESLLKTEKLNRIFTAYQNGVIQSEKCVELINNEKIFNVANKAMDIMFEITFFTLYSTVII